MKDIYVYEGTNVLKNKRNIRSNEELDQFENAMTSLAIININRNFVFKDLTDIFEIHNIFLKMFMNGLVKLEKIINTRKNRFFPAYLCNIQITKTLRKVLIV